MILFSDSFNVRGRWDTIRNGQFATNGGVNDAPCLRFSLIGGHDDRPVFAEKNLDYNGPTFYVSGWWRFPVGFNFNGIPGANSTEHKLFVIFTSDGIGRVLVNLRGGGAAPVLQTHLERLDPYPPGVSTFSATPWPTDDLWHRVEVELLRDYVNGRIRVWLDGRLAIDQSGRTCGYDRSPITAVQVGAYSNQGSVTDQFFFIDDVTFASSRNDVVTPEPPIVVPPPAPAPTFDPRPALELFLQQNLEMAERLDATSRKLRDLLK